MGEFAASIEHSKAKSVSASGGLRPLDPLTRRSARSPWPLPLPNPKYATGCKISLLRVDVVW